MKKALLAVLCLVCGSFLFADWHVQENFEGGQIPAGWTVVDQDGDSYAWTALNNSSHAHSGQYAMFCSDMLPHVNHDWLITPAITVGTGDSLSFYTRAWVSTETLQIKVSTSDTAINHFSSTLLTLNNIGTTYQQARVSLAAYAGRTIYLAFKWDCENYGILVDDVAIGCNPDVAPTLTLPDSLTFIQGQNLVTDFSQYITAAQGATLTCTGNTNVNVSITGYQVTLSSANWVGTENLTFTLSRGSYVVSDDVTVIVRPIPEIEIGLGEILAPSGTVFMNYAYQPRVTLINNGNSTLTTPVTINCVITTPSATVVNLSGTYDQAIEAGQVVTMTFTQSWTPDQTGQYTLVMMLDYNDGDLTNNTVSTVVNVVEHVGVGGPDDFGYCWRDSTTPEGPDFNWVDISTSGASAITQGVEGFYGDDNFSEPIDFGFSFPFYGQRYQQFFADTNGEILLGQNNPWYHAYPHSGWNSDGNVFNWSYPIPGYEQMPGLIAVYWDDLDVDAGTGDMYYQTLGTAPDRYCIIQWHNFRFHTGTGLNAYLDFEAIFYEDGHIVMQYLNTATGQTGSLAQHDHGQSATVAIQNEAGNVGLCYLRELVNGSTWVGVTPVGNMLQNNTAIEFYTDADIRPPVLTHTQVGNTFASSMNLVANITDLSPITEATLHYSNGSGWQSVIADSISTNGDYRFALANLTPGSTISYYFSATDAQNNAITLPVNEPDSLYSFKVLPGTGVRVLLTYSGTEDYENTELPVYEQALRAIEVDYDTYDWHEFADWQFNNGYDAIIVFSNSSTHTARMDTLSVALMNYMAGGTSEHPKNVFFASDGFAYAQSGSPNAAPMKKLLEAYFRTMYIPTGTNGGTNGLAGPDVIQFYNGTILGADGTPLDDSGELTDIYANSPDCILTRDYCPDWYADTVQYPEIGSHPAYLFEDGPIDGHAYFYQGVCGTWLNCGIYKSIYLSLDFSQIVDPEKRQQILEKSLIWFGVLPGSATQDNSVSAVNVSAANYPNPFNPCTTIMFNVPQSGKVELVIYNVRGQKVRTLVNGNQASGVHRVVFDGHDDAGKALASGMYFYRLTTAEKTVTNKMLLVK